MGKAANLPIQQPTKFDVIINEKRANLRSLKIPLSILEQATNFVD
jgi:hypothetical protein